MSAAVDRVLIVGGGFSGMSAAIQLRKLGVEVELVEIDPNWRSYGAEHSTAVRERALLRKSS